MSTDTDIVMSPEESTITSKDIFDPEMKYITVKEYTRSDNSDRARLETCVNTLRLFADFTENPSLVRRISIPIFLARRSKGGTFATAPETRAMSRRDTNCPRIKFITAWDGSPLDTGRLQYHRVEPIAPNSANVVVWASMAVRPSNLYVISHIDHQSRTTKTLVYSFVDFVEWPVDKTLRDSQGRKYNQYGIGNAELMAAFTQNYFGSMSKWVAERYRRHPEVLKRILNVATRLHSKRDVRAYRRYFGRPVDALACIPLTESDPSAPTVHNVQVSPDKLLDSVLDTAVEVRRDYVSENLTPSLPEGVTLPKEYNRSIPVACSLTAESDTVVDARVYINMGTYVRCYSTQLTDLPEGHEDAMALFGYARSFTELLKALSENGGMSTYRAVVLF